MTIRRNLTVGEIRSFLKDIDDSSDINILEIEYCDTSIFDLVNDDNQKIKTVGEFKQILRKYSRVEQSDDLVITSDSGKSYTAIEIRFEKNISFSSHGLRETNVVYLVSF